MAGFARRWSPQQIAERLAWEAGRRVLCHESIYRFVYRQQARVKDYRWSRCLPQGKTKRGWRGRGRSSSARFIAHRTSIHQRPVAVATRETFGRWEADLMSFGRSGAVVLALHERTSRLLVAVRQGSKRADATAATLERLLGALPPAWRQTLTFDNGTEFARHYRLHALGIQTFFCDTHSPWQKGGVENAIGRLRRPLPRSTNLAALSEEAFTAALQLYNNTPWKCLGYRTPAEVFHDQVLHFKCESTFPLSRERRGTGDGGRPAAAAPLDSCLRRNDEGGTGGTGGTGKGTGDAPLTRPSGFLRRRERRERDGGIGLTCGRGGVIILGRSADRAVALCVAPPGKATRLRSGERAFRYGRTPCHVQYTAPRQPSHYTWSSRPRCWRSC